MSKYKLVKLTNQQLDVISYALDSLSARIIADILDGEINRDTKFITEGYMRKISYELLIAKSSKHIIGTNSKRVLPTWWRQT